jgi:hypothetical protein
MNYIPLRSALLAGALALLVIGAGTQTAHAKDTWTTVHSKDFTLVGNASEKDIRQVANRLEQFRTIRNRRWPRGNRPKIRNLL